MPIDPAIAHEFSVIASRERDLRAAYTPGATPVNSDLFTMPRSHADLDPASASAPEGLYFVRRSDDGKRIYSTDGHIRVRSGAIVDANGYAILGKVSHDAQLTVLHIDAVDAALHRVQNLRIDADGNVRYDRPVVEPRTGARVQQEILVGRVALARFPAGTELRAFDPSHSVPPPGVLPHIGYAGDGTFASLQTAHRTTSSIDIDRGVERLQEAYLALDAMESAHKARSDVQKTTMDLVK